MITKILESNLLKLGESFLSKIVDKTADNALNNLKNIKDFELGLKTLHKSLKSLNAKACDVDEQVKNAVLSGRKKRKREVEEWLEEVRSLEKEVVELGSEVESEGFITRLMDGGIAAKLNEQVEKLVEQSWNFGELVLDVCGTKGETFLTNGLIGKSFTENLEKVVKLLEGREVSSIGIHGMGGVGKTTLAKHIHNRLLEESRGDVFWVTVSQEFTIMSLQDKIARLLGVDLLDEDEEDKRAARLHRVLSQMKNSVLILDDVWENIDMLKVGCPFSIECCKLIITTRSLEVCRRIRCQEVIPVQILCKEEAWKLFVETLGNEIQLGSRVEEIAKSMAKICDGLPLGIITVAGSMRGETSIHTWENALVELKECVVGHDNMGDDVVFRVLKYSFDRLKRNHHTEFNTFQLCFLYCSLYPEDFKICRKDLVKEFISEGLLDQRKNRRAQYEQGQSILDKLVNVCLLESCDDYIKQHCVKMHDLIRGMALKIGKGKYMVRAGEYSLRKIPTKAEWAKDLEKVSLMQTGIRSIQGGRSPNCPKLSTLILRGSPLAVIPDSFISKMQRLCTLDLCHTHITKLPDSICEMKSLKALLLRGCYELEKVPSLGGLKALRELNLSGTAIEEVPLGVEELLNLTFLSINAPRLKMIRSGLLLKLGNLQHVELPVHIQVSMEEIKALKQVEEFSGAVENVKAFNWLIRSGVHDTCYTVGIGSCVTARYRKGDRDLMSVDNELILCERNLKDEKVLWQDVVYLTMRGCECSSICFLDDPTSLKRLRIVRCGGVEIIWRNEQGIAPHVSTLEEIKLEYLEDLKELIQKGAAPTQPIFSSLRSLTIENCNKMRKVGLPGVHNLERTQHLGVWRNTSFWFLFSFCPRLISTATLRCKYASICIVREFLNLCRGNK